MLVNGVAKHRWLGRHLAPGIHVHLDSLRETHELLPEALAQGWQVGLRCHVPAERDARDRRFGGQFGMSDLEIIEAYQYLQTAGVRVDGLHFHLGQGARHLSAYRESVQYVVALCERAGIAPRYLDCGGGVDHAPSADAAFADLTEVLQWATMRIPSLREVWVENGGYVTRGSAALVVRVLDTKDRPEGRYLICDGGRTNHALDADNGPHPMLALPTRAGRLVDTTVCGPSCMSDDRLARVSWPEGVGPGDLVVWLDAGAYHLPWETRFSQGLSAVVWADAGERLTLARPRETPEQWSSAWRADQC
jgi:diaminopimelate decarboxylase